MSKKLSQQELSSKIFQLLAESDGHIIEDYLTIFQLLKIFGNGFTTNLDDMDISQEEFDQLIKCIPDEIRNFVFKTIEIIDERHEELGKILSKLHNEDKVKCVVIDESNIDTLH